MVVSLDHGVRHSRSLCINHLARYLLACGKDEIDSFISGRPNRDLPFFWRAAIVCRHRHETTLWGSGDSEVATVIDRVRRDHDLVSLLEDCARSTQWFAANIPQSAYDLKRIYYGCREYT